MINITETQIAALKLYLKDFDKMIDTGDAQDLLDSIDDLIVDNILSNNDEPDDEGIKLQRLYDQIFKQNS